MRHLVRGQVAERGVEAHRGKYTVDLFLAGLDEIDRADGHGPQPEAMGQLAGAARLVARPAVAVTRDRGQRPDAARVQRPDEAVVGREHEKVVRAHPLDQVKVLVDVVSGDDAAQLGVPLPVAGQEHHIVQLRPEYGLDARLVRRLVERDGRIEPGGVRQGQRLQAVLDGPRHQLPHRRRPLEQRMIAMYVQMNHVGSR